jgi:uncharacterized membrane protein YccC
MSAGSWPRALLFNPDTRRQGLSLLAGVVIAFAVSTALRLPEPLWSVMSLLIVMRPLGGLAFEAALARFGSTLLGVLCGLAGAGLEHIGVASLLTTLVIVGTLAYAGGGIPTLRGAAIAALIVMSSASISGHSANQVAMLRVIQIFVGAGVATLVSAITAPRGDAGRQFAGCAKLLRGAAARLSTAGQPTSLSEDEVEAAAMVAREALDRLSILARRTDRVPAKWFRRSKVPEDRQHRRILGLTRRILQDVTLFTRILPTTSGNKVDTSVHEIARVASDALTHIADVLDGRVDPDDLQLRRLKYPCEAGFAAEAPEAAPNVTLASPLYLLSNDLQSLSHVLKMGRPRYSHPARLNATPL